MPAERRRKTKATDNIPSSGDPERKRVLNILAQRRYRQRQREKIAALEAQAKSKELPEPPAFEGHRELVPRTRSTSPPIVAIEEMVRSSDGFDLPEIDFRQESLDMSSLRYFDTNNLPNPNPLATSSRSSSSSAPQLTSSDFSLSSDAQLQVPLLSAMHAFSSIATSLNLMNVVWDPDYLHVLSPTSAANLPRNLQPTPAQLTILHHPILDILPWPSVRERLICTLSLPSACRPPIAQNDDPCSTGQAKAIQRLIHDLDDPQEGIRVHGNVVGWDNSNELIEDAWEIGGCVYRNWWFCMDQNATVITNKRRRERGARPLNLDTQ